MLNDGNANFTNASSLLVDGSTSCYEAEIGDLDGDGNDDMLWRTDPDGAGMTQLHYWKMKYGKQILGRDIGERVSSDWVVGGIGDTNDDGHEDIIWRNRNTGEVVVWNVKDGVKTAGVSLEVVDLNMWTLGGVGDIDGDKKADIIFSRTTDGQLYVWHMSNNAKASEGEFGSPTGTQWSVAGVDDVTGDNYDDIFFLNSQNPKTVHYWKMENGERTAGIDVDSGKFPDWKIVGIGNIAPY